MWIYIVHSLNEKSIFVKTPSLKKRNFSGFLKETVFSTAAKFKTETIKIIFDRFPQGALYLLEESKTAEQFDL